MAGGLAIALAGGIWYEGQAATDAAIRAATETEARIKALEKTVAALEAQVGRPERQPTVFNNIERRFREQDQRNTELDRELRKLDDRIRKLEAAKR